MESKKIKQIEETSLVLVSSKRLENLESKADEILNLLKAKPEQVAEILNHLTEKEAIQLIGKKSTWFWQMRKSGKLKSTKIGGTVYYSLDDLKNLLKMGDC